MDSTTHSLVVVISMAIFLLIVTRNATDALPVAIQRVGDEDLLNISTSLTVTGSIHVASDIHIGDVSVSTQLTALENTISDVITSLQVLSSPIMPTTHDTPLLTFGPICSVYPYVSHLILLCIDKTISSFPLTRSEQYNTGSNVPGVLSIQVPIQRSLYDFPIQMATGNLQWPANFINHIIGVVANVAWTLNPTAQTAACSTTGHGLVTSLDTTNVELDYTLTRPYAMGGFRRRLCSHCVTVNTTANTRTGYLACYNTADPTSRTSLTASNVTSVAFSRDQSVVGVLTSGRSGLFLYEDPASLSAHSAELEWYQSAGLRAIRLHSEANRAYVLDTMGNLYIYRLQTTNTITVGSIETMVYLPQPLVGCGQSTGHITDFDVLSRSQLAIIAGGCMYVYDTGTHTARYVASPIPNLLHVHIRGEAEILIWSDTALRAINI